MTDLQSSRSANKLKRKHAQRGAANYLFNLPNIESSEDSEVDIKPYLDLCKPAFLCPTQSYDSSSSEIREFSEFGEIQESEGLTVPDKKNYSEVILSSILSCNGVTLSSAEKIVNFFNIYINRFSTSENLLPNVRYYWDKQAQTNHISVYLICEKEHLHGPFHGEPKNYGTYICDGEIQPVILKQDKYFLHIPFRAQVENHLPLLPESCWDSSKFNEFDICNSSEAKRIKQSYDDSSVKRLTLTLHADEVSIGNSSNSSIFPLFLTVNEMSRNFRRENFFLVGLFVGRKKPKVDIFLKPIVEELNQISINPVEFPENASKILKATFHLVAVIADAPMRAYLRSVRQFNHLNGCDWCLVKAGSAQGARVYPYLSREEIESFSRKHQDFLDFQLYLANRETTTGINRFLGLVGASPLLTLKDFNIVKGFSVEPMHCMVLGIFRNIIFKGWLKSEIRNVLENKIDRNLFTNEFGQRLKEIRVPSEFSRPPRDLNQIKFWKSAEYDSLLCYYFLTCSKGLLRLRVINNIACLIRIYVLMNSNTITHDIVQEISNLVDEFQNGVLKIYGENQCTYNLHILSHLPESINCLGPYANLNAYPLENQMGILKEKVRRTSSVAQSLVRVFLNDFKHRELMETKVNFWKLSEKENQILGTRSIRQESVITTIADDDSAKDEDKLKRILDPLMDYFGIYIVARLDSIRYYKSIRFNNIRYSTANYSSDKMRDDSVVRLRNGKFFQIETIIQLNTAYCFIGTEFDSSPLKFKFKGFTGDFRFTLDHIHEIKSLEKNKIVKLSDIKRKGIKIESVKFHYKYTKNFLVEAFLENK